MGLKRFKKVLIANRGEIAVRVARTLREMGIRSVAVYSDPDRTALHVLYADEAHRVGPGPAAESYLNVDNILEAARRSGADAVHPGYGFLSENGAFADRCAAEGLTFIGPSGDVMRAMGDKVEARSRMTAAGVSPVPGTAASLDNLDDLTAASEEIGFPVLIKASAGGGGKGMRRVDDAAELAGAFERARSEAQSAFGDGTVYLEKYLTRPRHIEVQIMADAHGKVLHLFERDCSIQRRHQKVIEECPSPALSQELRERLTAVAVKAASAVGYVGAGTLEFLLDEDGSFYFLEMNTRLQVEHPITELVTGLDLVELQVRVAQGEALPLDQSDVTMTGAAIECRVYAEDPEAGFLPSPGRIVSLRPPGGPGIREDTGVYEGFDVPVLYDPLLSKLCSYGSDRQKALARMERALAEYRLTGIKTNLSFHERVLRSREFQEGSYDTSFLDRTFLAADQARTRPHQEVALAVAAIEALRRSRVGIPKEDSEPANGWKQAALRMGIRGLP